MAQMQAVVGPSRPADGSTAVARLGKDAELDVSQLNARSYESCYRQRLFTAGAIVTAPVIFSTAAGTGGPFIWNGSTTVNAVLLKIGFSTSVVTTVAGGLGITGALGQSVVPTSTTVVDFAAKNCFIGGALPLCTAYRVATPLLAGSFFVPFAQFHTGALTVDTTGVAWVDLEGSIIVPPNGWASVAGTATLTTLVASVALIWAEVPI